MQFFELRSLKKPLQVTLGDGHTLEATGHETVALEMKLPDGIMRTYKLNDVLFVPKPSYNLLHVPMATKGGKTDQLLNFGCKEDASCNRYEN